MLERIRISGSHTLLAGLNLGTTTFGKHFALSYKVYPIIQLTHWTLIFLNMHQETPAKKRFSTRVLNSTIRSYRHETRQEGQHQGKDKAWYIHKKDGYEAVKKEHANKQEGILETMLNGKERIPKRLQSVYHF